MIPANVNVWMGASGASGASSGLHHDHHDNMYVLMRGTKTFELYAPNEIGSMYTVGTPRRVHRNGRVNYEESGPTRADGDAGDVAARVASGAVRAAEEQLDAAEAAMEAGEEGAAGRVADAERALDDAMDAAADGGGAGGDGDDFDGDGDDFDGDAFFGGTTTSTTWWTRTWTMTMTMKMTMTMTSPAGNNTRGGCHGSPQLQPGGPRSAARVPAVRQGARHRAGRDGGSRR